MNTLTKERTETKRRVAKLKRETKFEKLRKEVITHERELVEIKRPSIIEWIKKLFGKGGKAK